jgi:hypothetical protein
MKRFVLSLSLFDLAIFFGFLECVRPTQVAAQEVTSPQSAPTTASENDKSPNIVRKVSMFRNVGKLDTSTGAFAIDFYLSFSSDKPSEPPTFCV